MYKRQVGHLDLEGVAVGMDLGQIEGGQFVGAESLEPAGRIGERHAGDPLHILARADACLLYTSRCV